ncbi:hypothetical protein GJQ57_12440 [Ralstonia pickettii]|uniref:Uncharacterized protein n=1 Tax=Ralstonia pickettii TaxID=329 RepID=A0A7X2LBR9_RALPI|nr:hypothetical protein [Ralstonia pickettii]MRS99452.1 hypothetical protein [Ralstonia pickettii]
MATKSKKRDLAVTQKLLDFSLTDFFAESADFKSFKPAIDHPRGRFKTRHSIELFLEQADDEIPALRLKISATLTGYSAGEDKKTEASDMVDANMTFQVKLVAISRFALSNPVKINDVGEEPEPELVAELLATSYPLIMSKLRDYAADLGYRSVEPKLGLSRKSFIEDVVTRRQASGASKVGRARASSKTEQSQ